MQYGINHNFLSDINEPNSIREAPEILFELGVKGIRVPLHWAWLLPDDSGHVNTSIADLYHAFFESLPPSVNILGVPLNPPAYVASEYFEDQSALGERFSEFCGLLPSLFNRVYEWEIWNEPNAADFYLSCKDGEAHRPWTAEEFVSDVFLPGALAIRAKKPDDVICVGAVAEDGIVGHPEKSPVLCKRLATSPDFSKYLGPDAYNSFYFISDFSKPLLEALAKESSIETVRPLYNAVACHPYPYFNLHKRSREDRDLGEISTEYIQRFTQLCSSILGDQPQIWVTEVGARDLDLSRGHEYNPALQDAFLQTLARNLSQSRKVDRMYWYHLVDRVWDLRQEKTFGVCDHTGRPKPVFFRLKGLERNSDPQPRNHLVDTFSYSSVMSTGAVDPADWTESKKTHFGFIAASGTDGVLLSPGRDAGDWYNLEFKHPLALRSPFRFDLDLSLYRTSSDVEFKFELMMPDANEGISVSFFFSKRLKVVVDSGVRQVDTDVDEKFSTTFSADKVTGISILFRASEIICIWRFGEYEIVRPFSLSCLPEFTAARAQLTFSKITDAPTFTTIKRVSLSTQIDCDYDSYPSDCQLQKRDWFLIVPACSQIHQDEWVLLCLKGLKNGYFIEIGGHDGVHNSNTYTLERDFNWTGTIIEANPRWHREICRQRNCVAINAAAFDQPSDDLEFLDGGAIGGIVSHLQEDKHSKKRRGLLNNGAVIRVSGVRGDDLFERANAPKVIDFLSIDTEGSEVAVLKSINFNHWSVNLITVEHAGNEEKRLEAWSYLKSFGFMRKKMWFEDWFYHPDHLSQKLQLSKQDLQNHMDSVWRVTRLARRNDLISQAASAQPEMAGVFLAEADKPFYPPSSSALNAHIKNLISSKRTVKLARVLIAASNIRPKLLKNMETRSLLESFLLKHPTGSKNTLPNSHQEALEEIRSLLTA